MTWYRVVGFELSAGQSDGPSSPRSSQKYVLDGTAQRGFVSLPVGPSLDSAELIRPASERASEATLGPLNGMSGA